jgi:hypothetical protein
MAIYFMAAAASGGNDANSGTQLSPWATTAKALTVMVAGDTLFIRGGTYPQIFNLGTKHGVAGAPMTFSGFTGETAIITGTSGNAKWWQYTTDSTNSLVDYMTFQNMIFDSAGDTTEDADTGRIPDLNAVQNWILDGIEARNSHGLFLLINHTSHDITIRNCHFHHNDTAFPGDFHRYYAIYIHDANNILIENCEFDHTVGPAIQISPGLAGPNASGASGPNDNIVVRNCRMHDCNTYTATGNHGGGFIIAGQATNVQIYNNLIYNNGTAPTHGDGTGIFVSSGFSGSVSLLNNTIYGNHGYSNGTGGGWGIRVESGISGITYRNNICYGNDLVGILDDSGTSIFSNNLQTNPLFVNAAGLDFHLQSGSAARDAGFNIGSPVTTDFDGNGRPQGAGYDIGAYEFGSVSLPAIPTGLAVT